MGGDDADGPGRPDDRRDEPQGGPARRRWRGGRLLLALVVLLVAGLVTWAVTGPEPGDTDDTDEEDPTDVALLGPDLTKAGLRLDDDGDPPSRALGMIRSHRAEVDADHRTAHITLGTATAGMELARFAVLWCDMPPEASRGIEVPSGTITVHDVELEVPCAGKDGTPPVRGMVALPLEGTAILEVTGDLPSSGSATLAVYTEPTDGSVSPPLSWPSDVPAPPVPPDAVALDDEDAVPSLFGTTRSRLVEIGSTSEIRVHAARTGGVTVQVDGIPVSDDGDLQAQRRWFEAMGARDPDAEALADALADLWRTQEPDLRDGRWLVYAPGSQRTFPVPAALLPAGGERRTVAVSVTVEGDPSGLPQVAVTDAVESGPDAVGEIEPVPLELLDDPAPTHVQGRGLAAAWRVPQDGLLRTLPTLTGTQAGAEPPRLVATRSGSADTGVGSFTQVNYGVLVTHDGLAPLPVVDSDHASLTADDLQFGSSVWSDAGEDRWQATQGETAAVLPPVPGLRPATVLAYVPVPYEDFDFTDAPPPSMSFPTSGEPYWGPVPPVVVTLTEADLEGGTLALELGPGAEVLWITTHGPGRMELLRDGEPLPWESEEGWWSSWTDRSVTSEVSFQPRPGTLQVRVEGYDEGFRIEVRGLG